MIEQLFTWLSAVSALVAGFLWWKASTVSFPAPPETAGVGCLMGGYLISEIDGKRIDLHATLEAQSKWNSYAAKAATLAAVFGAFALLAKGH
jgi:hypothetical protein